MFSRTYIPTSSRVIWTSPHQNLSADELAKANNKNKLMYNDSNGEIQFMDYTFLDDVMVYPTLADFPATGDEAKMYLDQAENKVYRWAGGQYFYVPHDVYSKTESDTRYYVKADIYTKTEADNKYTIRNATNDMTGGAIDNITRVEVEGTATIDSTAVSLSKPILAGWQDWQFINSLNNKVLLDGSTTRINSVLDLQNNNLTNGGIIHATSSRCDNIQRGNGVSMITFTGDNDMNGNNKNLKNFNDIGATNTLTSNIKNNGLVTMINFPDGDTINFNGKNATTLNFMDSTTIETSDIKTQAGFSMMSFPNDNDILMHNKNVLDINNLEVNEIRRQDATTMINFPTIAQISMNGKKLINVSGINISGSADGIDGKIRTDLGDIDMFDNLWMQNNNIGSVNEVNATTANLTNTNTTNLQTDNLKRGNGTAMISFPFDTSINMNYKNLDDVNQIELNNIRRQNGVEMITLTNDTDIGFNNKSLKAINDVNASNVLSDVYKRGNGTQMIHFENNDAINFNYKEIFNGGFIETYGLKFDDGTEMLTLTNNTTINMNARSIENIDFLNANFMKCSDIRRLPTDQTMISFTNDAWINFHDKEFIACGKINTTGLERTISGAEMMTFTADDNITFHGNKISNVGDINGIHPNNHCFSVKHEMFTSAGIKFYKYTAPVGYLITSANFTVGTTTITGEFNSDTEYIAEYNDASSPSTITFRGTITRGYTSLGTLAML